MNRSIQPSKITIDKGVCDLKQLLFDTTAHAKKVRFERNNMKRVICIMLIGVLCFSVRSVDAAEGGSLRQPEFLDNFDRAIDDLFKSRLFFGNRIKAKIGGQSRYRFEYRDDFNLNDRTYEDDSIHLLRNRFNFDAAYISDSGQTPVRFFAEAQDARSFADSNVNQTALFENEFDLRQLFGEVKSPWKKLPITVKVGRQVLSYGDERFVGGFDWSNVARVFDAVKLVYTPIPRFQLDLFVSRVVRVERVSVDRTPHDDDFYGIYGAFKPFFDHMLDTFLFIRHNTNKSVRGERPGQVGELKEYTFGNRFKGKKFNFDYGTEYAIQLGSRSHNAIEAWAFHQELGYTFDKFFWTPRVYGEYNHASGDRNPTDGKFQTFDNLFPTNHNKYGYIDFVGLKNINNFMIGASVKPHKRLMFSTDFHWFFLDAKESAWFNAGGGVFRTASPRAGLSLGQEIDLFATYKFTEHISFLGGYSHFFASTFAENTGRDDDANFLYVQTVFNF